MLQRPATRWAAAGLAFLTFAAFLATACGDDDDPGTAATPTSTSAPTSSPASTGSSSGSIPVTAIDYAFEGVPETVPVGTSFSLVNNSTAEVHEIVAIRIADDETRSVEELLQLSDEELAGVVAEMPAMVIVAPPDSEGMVVLGDGTFTEPGRYGLLCFIPTGADPAAVMEAEGDFPEDMGGPPHAIQGMFAEVLVE